MDINQTKFKSPNSNLELMSLESQIFHDQIPYINPYCPVGYSFQTNQSPSFSSPMSISPFLGEQHIGNHYSEQEGDEGGGGGEEEEELGAMKEMMFKIAAMQPVDIDPATIHKPKRRNIRISDDPQSVAARHRRERISEKMRILQRLVPGGTKMDTASMLDEAIRYVKFLKRQIRLLQSNTYPTITNSINQNLQRRSHVHTTPSCVEFEAIAGHGFTFHSKESKNLAAMSFNHEIDSD